MKKSTLKLLFSVLFLLVVMMFILVINYQDKEEKVLKQNQNHKVVLVQKSEAVATDKTEGEETFFKIEGNLKPSFE